ncbi:MAG: tetratricopeptide repeat protein [Olsenella sp.]|nr:tetratricopeptide repeat protein [Olsenella sp.]
MGDGGRPSQGTVKYAIGIALFGAAALSASVIFALSVPWGHGDATATSAVAAVACAVGCALCIKQNAESRRTSLGSRSGSGPQPPVPAGASAGAPPVQTSSPDMPTEPVISDEPTLASKSHKPLARPGAFWDGQVAKAISRSDNVIATLTDFVEGHVEASQPEYTHLVSMLRRVDLDRLAKIPPAGGGLLRKNDHYWLALATRDLTDEQYDALLAAEAALSLNRDTPEAARLEAADDRAVEIVHACLASLVDLEFPVGSAGMYANLAYDKSEVPAKSEWAVRGAISLALESVRTPFRVVFDFRLNLASHLVVFEIETPRPQCLRIACREGDEMAEARDYALRLAVLYARTALSVSPEVSRAIVNVSERMQGEVPPTRLSLSVTRESLDSLIDLARRPFLEGSDFSTTDHLRVSLDERGWLAPVTPFMVLTDEEVSPAGRHRDLELRGDPVSPALAKVSGARIVSDFSINESAGRVSTWNQIVVRMKDTTAQVVGTLVETRDSTEDITVAEACSRVIQALLSGEVDASDKRQMARIFVTGSALDQAMRDSATLDADDPQQVVTLLSKVLDPLREMGTFLDDDHCIYRYFNSIPERISFNLRVDDHAREVRLVPDAYYAANSHISIAYERLGKMDRAHAHADEMLRIAPACVDAALRKVHILESESRLVEAIELLKRVLSQAITPHDAAWCHYRLAYLEWKLGREDLTSACYQRALTWRTDVYELAEKELDDLINSESGARRLTDDEASVVLSNAGIPLGCTMEDQATLAKCAVLAADEGIFPVAAVCGRVLYEISHDDEIADIAASLRS